MAFYHWVSTIIWAQNHASMWVLQSLFSHRILSSLFESLCYAFFMILIKNRQYCCIGSSGRIVGIACAAIGKPTSVLVVIIRHDNGVLSQFDMRRWEDGKADPHPDPHHQKLFCWKDFGLALFLLFLAQYPCEEGDFESCIEAILEFILTSWIIAVPFFHLLEHIYCRYLPYVWSSRLFF